MNDIAPPSVHPPEVTYDIPAMLQELRTLSPRVSIAQANPQGALASLAAFVADQSRQVLELATSILRERQAAPLELAALVEAVRSQSSRFAAIEARLDAAAANPAALAVAAPKPAPAAVPDAGRRSAGDEGGGLVQALSGPPQLSPAPEVPAPGRVARGGREWR